MEKIFYTAGERKNQTAARSGRVSSLQTLGTLDGPGVRFVVFMQGCPLRCGCCHNPETWKASAGTEYTADELVRRIIKYKEYFGREGGVTLSGGEPLLQPEFSAEIFRLCKKTGINTCLDTSGCILNEAVNELLKYTDYCMLDIKYCTDEQYKSYVGCGIEGPIEFLEHLNEAGITTRLRQVTVPGLNDSPESIEFLNSLKAKYQCVERIELLPFRKLCVTKYQKLGLEFPFSRIPEPSPDDMKKLENLLTP